MTFSRWKHFFFLLKGIYGADLYSRSRLLFLDRSKSSWDPWNNDNLLASFDFSFACAPPSCWVPLVSLDGLWLWRRICDENVLFNEGKELYNISPVLCDVRNSLTMYYIFFSKLYCNKPCHSDIHTKPYPNSSFLNLNFYYLPLQNIRY